MGRLLSDRVLRFVAPVLVLGLAIIVVRTLDGGLSPFLDPTPTLAVLLICTVLAEFVELSLPRGDDEVRFTSGTPFGFAILLVAGPGPAVVGWAFAVLVTELVRRAPPMKLVYNLAQYAINMWVAGLVFEALAVSHPPAQLPLSALDAPAVVAAGIAFFAMNEFLTIGVSSRALGVPFMGVARAEGTTMFLIDGLLVGLAPVVAVVAVHAPVLLALFGLPVAALWLSAREADRRRMEALHDALTGLPNRRLFRSETQHQLERAARFGGEPVVMWLDLDAFKEVNDALGHASGDEVLQTVATRLRASVREQDLVARLGGDEFGILVGEPRDRDAIDSLAGGIAEGLRDPIWIAGLRVLASASIGLAAAQPGDDAEELLRRADVAMYQAKETPKGIAEYTRSGDPYDAERLTLLAELRDGIERGELVVHYQPQVDLSTGDISSVEALVRWQHPRLGLLQPGRFVHLAERGGLMVALTTSVLRTAVAQTAVWRSLGYDVSVAVNVSPRSVVDEQLPDLVARTLDEHGLPGSSLILEVTENVLMRDIDHSARLLEALTARGVRVSIDDFGTGYSSLALLKQLPVSEIKVDRSFVSDMSRDHNARVIVESTIQLGRALGLDVVAEGVETLDSFDTLHRLGCTSAQGYLISRPVPAEEVAALLHAPPRPAGALAPLVAISA